MRKLIIISILLLSPSTAYALTPVLSDCVELAAREGYPTDQLTKLQYVRAKVRMAWLSKRTPNDPLVNKCAAAIATAVAMKKGNGPAFAGHQAQ